MSVHIAPGENRDAPVTIAELGAALEHAVAVGAAIVVGRHVASVSVDDGPWLLHADGRVEDRRDDLMIVEYLAMRDLLDEFAGLDRFDDLSVEFIRNRCRHRVAKADEVLAS